MDWNGSLTEGDDIIKGKIKIPNLSEENEPEDITVSHYSEVWHIWSAKINIWCQSLNELFHHVFFQVEISTNKDNEESYILKQLLIKHGTPLIRDNLAKYIRELREGKQFYNMLFINWVRLLLTVSYTRSLLFKSGLIELMIGFLGS